MFNRKHPAQLRNKCNLRIKVELKNLVSFGWGERVRFNWCSNLLYYKTFGQIFIICADTVTKLLTREEKDAEVWSFC